MTFRKCSFPLTPSLPRIETFCSLNLDWKPVPIIPKFVDIVVNGISDRSFDIKAYSQDPYGVDKRTRYMESILRDMQTKDLAEFAQAEFGVSLFETDPETLPKNKEELELHMQLSYKQQVELAEEQAISVLLDGNKYDLIKRRCNYDITTIGIGAVKNTFTKSEGVKVSGKFKLASVAIPPSPSNP